MERLKICGWMPTRSITSIHFPILASVQQIVQQPPRHTVGRSSHPSLKRHVCSTGFKPKSGCVHYSIRTESAYVDWALRFILFHGKRHLKDMGALEVEAFLTWLAVERNVAAATQHQAKSALLFLYGQVLKLEFPGLMQ